MIAGDAMRRNYSVGNFEEPDPGKSEWAALNQTSQVDLAQRALGFNCLDYSKAPEGSLYRHFLPSKDYIDANCPDGIRAELMFPSCWDGVNLDSDDHQSHVAYPDLVINGDCPDSHPVRLPGLFYETIWDMGSYSDRTGLFAFANGDPLGKSYESTKPERSLLLTKLIGFGYHGDFIMGWDSTNFTLQEAVDTCTDLSGEIEACPLFTVISEAEQKECQFDVPTSLVKEDIAGPLKSLPGGVALAWGPEPANMANSESGSTTTSVAIPTTVAIPTLSYSAGSIATNNASVVPGNVFKVTPTTSAPTVATITEAATLTSAADGDYVTVGTSTYTFTGTDGSVTISEIVVEEAVTWVTELTTTTVTVEPTGVARRRDAHFHAHRHRHIGHKH